MKSFGRVILAFTVAVLGFASVVFDAGLGALRVNKFSTGFSRTPSQIVSTHTPDDGDGAGDDADDSKPIGDDTPLTELDLAMAELTQVMDDFVKVFSQFDFSIYTDRNGRVFELYCFGYLYTDGRFDTKWLKSTNVYDYQEAIASMKSLTTLVTKVLASAREEVPAPNLVSFEKYFESIDDYINQLNAEYQPLTYVTCQNTRPSK